MTEPHTVHTDRLVIYGAGGHGLVAADAATASGWRVEGFVDDNASTTSIAGRPLWHRLADATPGAAVFVAIGDNAARLRILDALREGGTTIASVLHPSAVVSPTAAIAPGVFVGPLAVVNALATLERGAVVNSGAIVEHHNRVGVCAHVAPGATLAGGVVVGDLALVGAGSSVRPRVRIGARATVGAGSAVISDVADDATVAGVPAKPLAKRPA